MIQILPASIKKPRWTFFLFPFLFVSLAYGEDVHSTLYYRVTNRKYISHLVLERVNQEDRITLITVQPGPYAFKAQSYTLYHICENPSKCMVIIKKLNAHLNSGSNIGMNILGSRIITFQFPGL